MSWLNRARNASLLYRFRAAASSASCTALMMDTDDALFLGDRVDLLEQRIGRGCHRNPSYRLSAFSSQLSARSLIAEN